MYKRMGSVRHFKHFIMDPVHLAKVENDRRARSDSGQTFALLNRLPFASAPSFLKALGSGRALTSGIREC